MAFVLEMSIILHILLITVDRSVIMNIFLIIIKGVQFTFEQGGKGTQGGGINIIDFCDHPVLSGTVLCSTLSHTTGCSRLGASQPARYSSSTSVSGGWLGCWPTPGGSVGSGPSATCQSSWTWAGLSSPCWSPQCSTSPSSSPSEIKILQGTKWWVKGFMTRGKLTLIATNQKILYNWSLFY